MHDHAATLRRPYHVVTVERIAAHPVDAVALFSRRGQAALECLHLPTAITQLPRHFAANAAVGAQYQDSVAQCCHVDSPERW